MGQKIVLTETFTDTSLPRLRDDPLLSSGSLFLFDPTHSLGGFVGVPASGATVPNVAWKEASAILGSGDATSLAATITNTGNVAGKFQVERSAKGGLHGIITQGGSQVADHNFLISLPTAVRDYVYSHRLDRSFFFSLWYKLTRPGISNAAPQSHYHFAASTSNHLFFTQGGTFTPSSGGAFLGRRTMPSTSGDVVQPAGTDILTNGGVFGISGTGPISTNPINAGLGTFNAWGSLNWNKAPSIILYRVYAEDLTASGRTYAQADAADLALWQTALASGGKLFGDTYTNPSTLP